MTDEPQGTENEPQGTGDARDFFPLCDAEMRLFITDLRAVAEKLAELG